jgi:hypothetical protein
MNDSCHQDNTTHGCAIVLIIQVQGPIGQGGAEHGNSQCSSREGPGMSQSQRTTFPHF